MRLSLNQRGASQIILPLFLVAAVALAVYLAQQPTELTPSAAEVPLSAPQGCTKVSPGRRLVQYKNCQSSAENCGVFTPLTHSQEGERDVDPGYKFPPPNGVVVAGYPLKETVWEFGGGWKSFSTKGARQPDGERTNVGKARFDGPDGKSYEEVDADPAGENREATKITYREKGGQGLVVEYVYLKTGTNYQGIDKESNGTPSKTYDATKSYAFVPDKAGTKCDGTATTTGAKANGAACTANKGTECKSGVCTDLKCAQGSKKGGDTCTNREECQSNSCSNGKCSGGTRANGQACDGPQDCASDRCTDNKCVAREVSNPTRSPSPTARASSGSGGGGPGGGGGNPSTAPSASASASVRPASAAPSASSGGSAPISLTKAEITGFKNSYDLLHARLGSTATTGNLKVTSTIAKSELDSIVSQLPTCPDDSNVGTCLDSKFRTRFDFAKTAARLTAFYAIFNNVSGICVKSDFGLNPLITATSSTNTQGRVNLCTEPAAAQKLWRVFVGGKFEPIISTDTRWPANPACGTLPADVLAHYRNAETLFNTQSGFISNTLCDGKTTAESPGQTGTPTTTVYSSETECNGSCSLTTNRCGLSKVDSKWHCLPKGVFNKDYHCTTVSSDTSNTCPASHSSCDVCGQCRNASLQILPGTPNPMEGICRPT